MSATLESRESIVHSVVVRFFVGVCEVLGRTSACSRVLLVTDAFMWVFFLVTDAFMWVFSWLLTRSCGCFSWLLTRSCGCFPGYWRVDVGVFQTGWMMWNWFVSALAVGAAIVCYDGSPLVPNPNIIWDLVDQIGYVMQTPRLCTNYSQCLLDSSACLYSCTIFKEIIFTQELCCSFL